MISVETALTVVHEEHQHHPIPPTVGIGIAGQTNKNSGGSTASMSATVRVVEVGESSSSRSEARSAIIIEEHHDMPEFASDKWCESSNHSIHFNSCD
jgi:hypothetical protein